jgi:endonuclease/exonuclease/phosphatase family metal-dependent hydrolase
MLDISTVRKIQNYIRSTRREIIDFLFPKKENKENFENFPDRRFHKFLDMNTVFLKAESLIAPIKSIKFDKERNLFDKFENKYIDNNINDIKNFSILTYNVWFDRFNYKNRRDAILEILKQKDASVICLQEVIQPFLEFIKEDDFIKNNYYISDSILGPYNIVMLSKFPLRFYHLTFPTNQNRYLIIGEIKLKSKEISKSIIFSTSHFESLDKNSDFRRDQMMRTFKVINEFKNAFLLGDFNIDDKINRDEMSNFDSLYTDSWKIWMSKNPKLKEEDGYTYYEDNNEPKQRLDRILFGNYSDFELQNFEIIGKDKIKTNPNDTSSSVSTPSDHQGLYAEFSRIKN